MNKMISNKQLELMRLILKDNGISYQKQKIYTHKVSCYRALEDLVKKDFCIKKKNYLDENVYLLSTKGNNLLVVLGYRSYFYLIFPR